jgi:hypothetical protein
VLVGVVADLVQGREVDDRPDRRVGDEVLVAVPTAAHRDLAAAVDGGLYRLDHLVGRPDHGHLVRPADEALVGADHQVAIAGIIRAHGGGWLYRGWLIQRGCARFGRQGGRDLRDPGSRRRSEQHASPRQRSHEFPAPSLATRPARISRAGRVTVIGFCGDSSGELVKDE